MWAFRLARRTGSLVNVAMSLVNMSYPERELGRLDKALSHIREATRLFQELQQPPGLRSSCHASYAQT